MAVLYTHQPALVTANERGKHIKKANDFWALCLSFAQNVYAGSQLFGLFEFPPWNCLKPKRTYIFKTRFPYSLDAFVLRTNRDLLENCSGRAEKRIRMRKHMSRFHDQTTKYSLFCFVFRDSNLNLVDFNFHRGGGSCDHFIR